MVVLATPFDTGPSDVRPLGADGTTNAETSELGVAASTTHDVASAVTGKEGIFTEKYRCTHLESAWVRALVGTWGAHIGIADKILHTMVHVSSSSRCPFCIFTVARTACWRREQNEETK